VVLSTLSHVNFAVVLGRVLFPSGTRVLVRQAGQPSLAIKDEHHPRLWEWLYRRCYKRADGVICLSDFIADDLVTHFAVPRTKVVRIYNPVDVKGVREMAEMGGSPFAGPGPHLVAAGRLSREKGFDILLAAMPAVLARLPRARLTILGEGALRADLTRHTHTLGLTEAVALPGFQLNPWPYFRHADLFVLPSRYEGLPNVLLEALALGTPVIAADCPGGIREVQAMSQGIVTVPQEDPQALADAIIATCNEQHRSRDRAGELDEGIRNFDLQGIVGEYTRLLLS
jgi:glycosyltransferase involved in cell wall biosynthesis